MRGEYPDDWRFIRHDAYTFEASRRGLQWDVVSCDPFTNEFDRCADHVNDWCGLARHVVVLGTGLHTVVHPPAGWRVTGKVRRTDYAGGVYWTVLERA